MDPLAAVCLAGNVLQFLGLISNLISPMRQIHFQGVKQGYPDLEEVAKMIQASTTEITRMVPEGVNYNEDDRDLPSLASRCTAISNELIHVLKSRKPKGKRIIKQNFYLVLLSEWTERDIRLLLKRLDWISQQLNSYFSPSKLGEMDRIIERLATENRRLDSTRAKEIEELKRQLTSGYIAIKSERYDYRKEERVCQSFISAGELGMRLSAEQQILEQLRFETMDDRYMSTKDVHKNTASWIFGDTQASSRTATNFSEWLTSPDNLYWISGKPGSGKSTLMKHISTHQKTSEQLEKWAKGYKLVIASFFFWNAAKETLQKDQQGLLRSIIYQILWKCPDLMPEVYRECWPLNGRSLAFPYKTKIPTSTEALLAKMELISTKQNLRIALFIDGLDEYERKPTEIIAFIKILQSMPNVKICASSRPLKDFESFFEPRVSEKVYMQDHNSEDMRAFIEDSLRPDLDHQEVARNRDLEKLVQETTKAAQGVFLWVCLVVEFFKEALASGDSVIDLQAMLKEFPTDLDGAFEKVLFGVENVCREQALQMMLITQEAQKDLPMLLYWFVDQDIDWEKELEPFDGISTKRYNDQMHKRLNACCKGLLEVQRIQKCPASVVRSPTHYFEHPRVVFLHRCVRDYFQAFRAKERLLNWSSGDFSADESICQGLLCMVKAMPKETNNAKLDTLTKLLWTFFGHAVTLEGSQFKNKLIEHLDTAVASFHYSPQTISYVYTSTPLAIQATALPAPFTMQRGTMPLRGDIDSLFALSWFCGLKQSVACFLRQSQEQKALNRAFHKAMWTFDSAFVHFVLAHGNPSHRTGIHTAVSAFLKDFCENAQMPGDGSSQAEKGIYDTIMSLFDNEANLATRRSSALASDHAEIQSLRRALSNVLTTEHSDAIVDVFKNVSHLAYDDVKQSRIPLLEDTVGFHGYGNPNSKFPEIQSHVTGKALEAHDDQNAEKAVFSAKRTRPRRGTGKFTVMLRKGLICWRE